MEFANAWTTISGQGVMFWTAAGAVALGVTLILISGVVQLGRLRGRAVRNIPGVPEISAEYCQKVPEVPVSQDLAREIHDSTEKTGPKQLEQDSKEVRLLLDRLRSAADQLEDFRRTRQNSLDKSVESSLKESCPGVDYVFRAGTG